MSGNKKATTNIDNSCNKSADVHELLRATVIDRITIDSGLLFENHVNNLCKKTSQKIKALARISQYMTLDKRKMLEVLISLQFSYYHLVWMFQQQD